MHIVNVRKFRKKKLFFYKKNEIKFSFNRKLTKRKECIFNKELFNVYYCNFLSSQLLIDQLKLITQASFISFKASVSQPFLVRTLKLWFFRGTQVEKHWNHKIYIILFYCFNFQTVLTLKSFLQIVLLLAFTYTFILLILCF